MLIPLRRIFALPLAGLGFIALLPIAQQFWQHHGPRQVRLFNTPSGSIMVDDEAKARWAAMQLAAAADTFRTTFGRSPPRGLIVDSRFVSMARSVPKDRRGWTLAWMPSLFGDDTARRKGGRSHHFDNESGMRHELTHLFFTASVLPNTRGLQYGGDAPDWLDEAAAISAETPRIRATRLAALRVQTCEGRLVPLDQFARLPHPLFASASMRKLIAEQRTRDSGRSAMMTVRPDQIDVPEREIADFYAEATGLLTYLVERSGDQRILERIAAVIRTNRNPVSWQDDPSLLRGLRLRRGELNVDFERWAIRRARCGPSAPNAIADPKMPHRTMARTYGEGEGGWTLKLHPTPASLFMTRPERWLVWRA